MYIIKVIIVIILMVCVVSSSHIIYANQKEFDTEDIEADEFEEYKDYISMKHFKEDKKAGLIKCFDVNEKYIA